MAVFFYAVHLSGSYITYRSQDTIPDESTEEGEQTGADGFLTQRRSYDFRLDDVDAGFQVTGVQHGSQVLGFFDGEVTGDFGVTVRDLAADGRSRIDELVKHDGDVGHLRAVVGGLAGDLTPLVGSLVFHGHGHHHTVVLVNVLTGGAHHAVAADGLRTQQYMSI